jgi:hypothetical protein
MRLTMLRHARCQPVASRFLLTAPLVIALLLLGAARGICAEATAVPSPGYATALPYQPAPLNNEVMLVAPPTLREEPRVPPPPTQRHWYGYQLMLSDAASIALIAGAAGGGATAGLGGVSFFFGGSVIHGVHKQAGWAVASPLMRAGFTVVGALVGMTAENCSSSDNFCGLGGLAVGGGLGLLTAMIVDYSVAWTEGPADAEAYAGADADHPVAKSRSSRITFASAGLAPLRNGGASLVLGGRF